MFALELTAELTGVTDLRPADSEEKPFWYTFKVQCTSCRETHPKSVGVSRFELSQVNGSRGDANFAWRCKHCKRESTANIRAAPAAYQLTEPPKKQRVIEIDCRGLDFTDFLPEGEWLAEGVDSNFKFSGIELSEGDWFDYDEKAGVEVSIKDLKWEINRV